MDLHVAYRGNVDMKNTFVVLIDPFHLDFAVGCAFNFHDIPISDMTSSFTPYSAFFPCCLVAEAFPSVSQLSTRVTF